MVCSAFGFGGPSGQSQAVPEGVCVCVCVDSPWGLHAPEGLSDGQGMSPSE